MKHLQLITQNKAAKAATWQDATCTVISFIADVFGSFGAVSPGLNVLVDKCDPTT